MICVIIPTLNAGDCLDGILSDLTQASVSIIVADGGSEDITVAQALQAGASLAVGAPGRGTQLARGADWAAQRAQVEWCQRMEAALDGLLRALARVNIWRTLWRSRLAYITQAL